MIEEMTNLEKAIVLKLAAERNHIIVMNHNNENFKYEIVDVFIKNFKINITVKPKQ